MVEIWKDIKDYPDYYISNFGKEIGEWFGVCQSLIFMIKHNKRWGHIL